MRAGRGLLCDYSDGDDDPQRYHGEGYGDCRSYDLLSRPCLSLLKSFCFRASCAMPLTNPSSASLDPIREGSRRGSLNGAPISTPRRPRSSVFKESSAADEDETMEDVHSARLRERPKKERSRGSILSASRSKRTRHASREFQAPPRTEEMDETAEDGKIGASEEDDLIPPAILSRRAGKLRFQRKIASGDGITIETLAVPRKARTATTKRPHETTHGDGLRQHSFTLAPLPSSPITTFSEPSGAALKSAKRMKPNGTKLRASKLAKVSTSSLISEQEVEVAEALFNLARMVSNLGSPLADDRFEMKTENAEPNLSVQVLSLAMTPMPACTPTTSTSNSPISSPVPGSVAISTPVSSCYSLAPAAEAPKRKRPCVKLKIEDGTLIQYQSRNDAGGSVLEHKAVADCTGQSTGPNRVQVKVEVNRTESNGSASTGYGSLVIAEIPLDNIVGSDLPVESNTTPPTASPRANQESTNDCKPFDACNPLAMHEQGRRETSHRCKYEIDLMATPKASVSGTSEKTGNSLESFGLELNKKMQDPAIGSSIKDERDGMGCLVGNENVKVEGKDPESGMEERAGSSHARLQEKEVKEEKIRENEREKQSVEVLKQAPLGAVTSMKILQQAMGGSGGLPGWPGSLPYMEYYSPAAAAAGWPAAGVLAGATSKEEKDHSAPQVPLFLFPSARPPCKRCATHVYIAHFIDAQQQMQWHPLCAVTYGNTAAESLYSMKPYNLNIPLAPDTIFGSGVSGLTGLSGSNSIGNKGGPQNDKGLITNNAQSSKEKGPSLYVDAVARKGASQPFQAGQILPLQAGLGPVFGYPVCASPTGSSLSSKTGGNNTLISGSLEAGSAVVVASCSEPTAASAGGSSNTDSVNAASAQVQHLQAIIQQAGFLFPLPPGHSAPPTTGTGHITQQQATQFLGNSFYNPPLVHCPSQLQTGPAASRTISKTSPLPNQSASMHQGVHVSHSVSQQQLSSASSSQSHRRVASQQLQRFGDRERNMSGETVSSTESKRPALQGHMHSQGISNMQASNLSSSSPVRTAGMPVVPAQITLDAKQVGNAKLPNQQQQSSRQIQSEWQTMIPLDHLIPHHHSSNSALPVGVKSIDFQPSQALSSMSTKVVSKNLVRAGPFGLAPVAAVMPPQGHAVLQTITHTERSHLQALQQQTQKQNNNKFIAKMGNSVVEKVQSNLEESRVSSSLETIDDNRTPVKWAMAAGGPSKMDLETGSNTLGSSAIKSGLPAAHLQQSVSGASFNFMASSVGNLSSRQVGPIPVGCISAAAPSPKPAMGQGKAMSNMTATVNGSTSLNKILTSGAPFHAEGVSCSSQNTRQGQAASWDSSQTKLSSRMQVGTAGVTTAPSSFLPGTYAGAAISKHQGHPARSQQASGSSTQSRLPPTVSGSPPSPSLIYASKSSSRAAVKNFSPSKSSSNPSQKQATAASAKRPDSVLTQASAQMLGPTSTTVSMGHFQSQSSAQMLGPNSITVSMGHSQSRQQQSQHQQIQHVVKQQQPSHISGRQSTVALQYHQASGTNQIGQVGLHKHSVQPQLQMKQNLYSQQQFYQQPQPQPTQSQHSTPPSIQQQSAQHHVISAANQTFQQYPDSQQQQAGIDQVVSSHQHPFSLSFAVSSSGAFPHTSSTTSIGTGSGGRSTISDGALNQLTSPKLTASMKPSRGTGGPTGSNIQRSSNSSSGFPHSQVAAVGGAETCSEPPCTTGSNASYLPYLHSAAFSSSAATSGKTHGASFIHSQCGVLMTSTKGQSTGGGGREDGALLQSGSDRISSAPQALQTSGNPHSNIPGSANKLQNAVSRTEAKTALLAAPVVMHGLPGPQLATTPCQANQTLLATATSITADSFSPSETAMPVGLTLEAKGSL